MAPIGIIIFGIIALFFGATIFFYALSRESKRNKHPRLHRISTWLFRICILIIGTTIWIFWINDSSHLNKYVGRFEQSFEDGSTIEMELESNGEFTLTTAGCEPITLVGEWEIWNGDVQTVLELAPEEHHHMQARITTKAISLGQFKKGNCKLENVVMKRKN